MKKYYFFDRLEYQLLDLTAGEVYNLVDIYTDGYNDYTSLQDCLDFLESCNMERLTRKEFLSVQKYGYQKNIM